MRVSEQTGSVSVIHETQISLVTNSARSVFLLSRVVGGFSPAGRLVDFLEFS